MKVDVKCSVGISNLSEEECILKPVNTTTNNPDSQDEAPLSITLVAVVVYSSGGSDNCYHNCCYCYHCVCLKGPQRKAIFQGLIKSVCYSIC